MLPGWIWIIQIRRCETIRDVTGRSMPIPASPEHGCGTRSSRWLSHSFWMEQLWYHLYECLANRICQTQRNWWIREKYSSGPFAFHIESFLHPKPTIKERNLDLINRHRLQEKSRTLQPQQIFIFVKTSVLDVMYPDSNTTKIWRQDVFPTWCSPTCKDEKWWVRVSDNRGWWLPPAWQTPRTVGTGTHGWCPGPFWRPLLLSNARWEECLHRRVNIRLESEYRLAESCSLNDCCLHGWPCRSHMMGGIHPH